MAMSSETETTLSMLNDWLKVWHLFITSNVIQIHTSDCLVDKRLVVGMFRSKHPCPLVNPWLAVPLGQKERQHLHQTLKTDTFLQKHHYKGHENADLQSSYKEIKSADSQ